jgi:hypothetical protein
VSHNPGRCAMPDLDADLSEEGHGERYRRERFFADLHAAYKHLRADPTAWEAELAERAELEGTLADGLDQA